METVVDVALKDGTRMLVSLAEDRVFEPGQAIELGFDPERAHLFASPAETARTAA
ncbi:TOBE domain-containing protein [Roseibium sp.]|uniref:TOBE domain-containing protein n=1 Tax=Roseibium sp. TaxID=1936156 RepID=UPI003422B4F2